MSRLNTFLSFGQAVEFVRTGYGKNIVKLLHIKRQGKFQDIKELEVSVQLTLRTKKDYLDGDNADIIPTDTIKNTVHVLAKLKGVRTAEEFALDICSYFLNTFKHVERVRVNIDEAPWKRLEKNGVEHVHAFIYSPEVIHFCEAEQYQNEAPVLHSGLKEMKVLKTTQSGFEGFIKDNHTVKNSIIEQFAGPYNEGEYSPSVQKTLYDTQVLVLNRVPEVLLPLDNPSGNITGTVRRRPFSKL
ncbi:URIC Uricase, partial [Polypterus senegalus]